MVEQDALNSSNHYADMNLVDDLVISVIILCNDIHKFDICVCVCVCTSR